MHDAGFVKPAPRVRYSAMTATVTGVTADSDGRPPASPDPTGPRAGDHPPEVHHPVRERLADAALRAEMMTGDHELTEAEARESMHRRLARGGVGMALVVVGIVLLPLPGPGWLIVIAGLTQLPFAWAERTVLIIRRRIPGVPESGAVPTHTWIIMGVHVLTSTAAGMAFGDDLTGWLRARF
jgi:hypothetical protein